VPPNSLYVVHETHRVAGKEAERFWELLRDGWMKASEDVRLLWALEQAHGTGPAYTFITLLGASSLDAYAAMDERVKRGDLREWWTELDSLRHNATAKVLVPTEFSPMTELDLSTVPSPGDQDHGPDLPLFMEDTAWPHPGKLGAYLERAGTLYLETLRKAAEFKMDILELVAAFTPMLGAGPEREVVLWQRIKRPEFLQPLFAREVPPEHQGPGTWMHDALEVRDSWESRLLRVAPWSPLA
jgi:hypothetical protein